MYNLHYTPATERRPPLHSAARRYENCANPALKDWYHGRMRIPKTAAARSLLMGVAALLVLKVTLSVVIGYSEYFPPDFDAQFLLGRESYFWGAYSWAFYTHL